MVRSAEKPSLRAASCWSVEVVKGGAGLRLAGFASTATMVKLAALIVSTAAFASASFPSANLSSFFAPSDTSRALNGSVQPPPDASWAARTSASTVQYSCGLNASISISRSVMSRSETDWTRPADREPGSLRQSTGESVKPTR